MKATVFNDALKSMLEAQISKTEFGRISERVAKGIRQGQRFFVPFGGGPVEDRKFEDFLERIRLPYPVTVVATESVCRETPSDKQTWVLVCSQMEDATGFTFVGCLLDSNLSKDWIPLPPGSAVWDDAGKMRLGLFDSEPANLMIQANPNLQVRTIYGGVVSSVVALCVMAGLDNVTTETVEPSARQNAKLKSRGKLPLYSYKILNVDGERWESNGFDSGDGQGYRSHLRRGHIRRLADGRAVWVRATYVHGRVAGFVDKDYNLGALH